MDAQNINFSDLPDTRATRIANLLALPTIGCDMLKKNN